MTIRVLAGQRRYDTTLPVVKAWMERGQARSYVNGKRPAYEFLHDTFGRGSDRWSGPYAKSSSFQIPFGKDQLLCVRSTLCVRAHVPDVRKVEEPWVPNDPVQ